MSSGKYTNEAKVREALFPKKRPRAKPDPQWLQKKRMTVNSKLRREIMDVLPFDVDKRKADQILHAIFDTIAEKVASEGHRILIPTLGYFYPQYHPLRKRYNVYTKQFFEEPAYYTIGFKASAGTRKILVDKEIDGDSGPNSRA